MRKIITASMMVLVVLVCGCVLQKPVPTPAPDDPAKIPSFNYTSTSEFVKDLRYLADDLNNLPEIQDGVEPGEVDAIKQIADLMRSDDPEVQQGLRLIEKHGGST